MLTMVHKAYGVFVGFLQLMFSLASGFAGQATSANTRVASYPWIVNITFRILQFSRVY